MRDADTIFWHDGMLVAYEFGMDETGYMVEDERVRAMAQADIWTGFVHSPECVKHQADMERWQERWGETYCRQCNGWGQHSYPGDFYEPPSTDPCSECTEHSQCARCGVYGLDARTGEGPCSACGWNYDDGLDQGCICDPYE